jgi:hypothetical protein
MGLVLPRSPQGHLALFGRPAQVREFFNLAGQLVKNGAFDELAQEQPLLLAVVDAVFAAEGGQEVVEPEEYGDLSRAALPGDGCAP